MHAPSLSSANLDERRRRILFRAWRRGLREMDLVMGKFADANLAGLDESELAQFEALLDVPDPEILAWITGGLPTPEAYDTALFARVADAPREALSRSAHGR